MKIINEFHKRPHNERRAIVMSGVFFLICTALGVLFHFAFDFLNRPMWLAPLFPINESVFEHLKLSFVPYVIVLFPIEYYLYGRFIKKFIAGRLLGVIAAMSFSVMEFYTIKGAFGEPPMAVNIIIFCAATLISYLVPLCLALFAKEECSDRVKIISLVLLALIFIIFIVFTYNPPKIPLFLDVTNGTYGYPPTS